MTATHEHRPPTASDAIAHWFDDVFRIYGDMVDSQRRLAVALVQAASPVLDVGHWAGETAADGAERLSAVVPARREVHDRQPMPTWAPTPGPADGESVEPGEPVEESVELDGPADDAEAPASDGAATGHLDDGEAAVAGIDAALTADLEVAAPTAPEHDDPELSGDADDSPPTEHASGDTNRREPETGTDENTDTGEDAGAATRARTDRDKRREERAERTERRRTSTSRRTSTRR